MGRDGAVRKNESRPPEVGRTARRAAARAVKLVAEARDLYASNHSEDAISGSEHFVERILEERRRFSDLTANLFDVFIVALSNLVPKQLLECAVRQAVGPLSRLVRHHVRHQRASESFRARHRIAAQERIDHPRGAG